MSSPADTQVELKPIGLDVLMQELASSRNLCDLRKARDLEALVRHSQGPWAGRFAILHALAQPDRMLVLITRLQAKGLVWAGKPQMHDLWTLAIGMKHNYPLSLPVASFTGVVPYNPHVAHGAFVPDERGLPADLQHYIRALRMGYDGGCCFVRTSQWSPATTHDLALAVWQISRLLTGAHFFGERAALNTHACSHYLALAEQGLLPLGPALPPPEAPEAGAAVRLRASAHAKDEEDEDVEWLVSDGPGAAAKANGASDASGGP